MATQYHGEFSMSREISAPLPRALPPSMATAKTGNRTQDLRITSALLYQLSYLGVPCSIQKRARNGNG